MIQASARGGPTSPRWGPRASALLMVWAAGACSSATTSPAMPTVGGPDQTSEVTINGAAGASVTVLPGASPTPVSVAIAQDATGAPTVDPGLEMIGPVFAVTPHGTQFLQPVTVRIPFDQSRRNETVPPVVLKANPGGQWVTLPNVALRDGFAEVEVTSFSLFVVAQRPLQAPRSNAPTISIAPIGTDYFLDASNQTWKYTGPLQIRPALVPVQVTLAGNPACASGETPEILAWSHALDQYGALWDWTSTPGRGWPISSAAVELPLIAQIDFRALYRDPRLVNSFTFELKALLVCSVGAVARTIASSSAVERFLVAGEPFMVGVGPGPSDVSAAPGERPRFTVEILGGPALPPGADPFDDQYGVEWQRSDDDGQTWLASEAAIAFAMDLPDEVHYGGDINRGNLLIRTSTLTERPVQAEDDGALFRARACYTPPAIYRKVDVDCVFSRAARLSVRSTSGPTFTSDPQSILVTAGSTATFSTSATGAPAPRLQWQSLAPGATTWVDISGATRETYNTAATGLADNGIQLRAVATNSVGSAISRPALLDVTVVPVAPSIEVQPFDVTAAPGATASFVVVAHGSDPLSYQWRRDGTAIAGATGPRLDVPAVAAADSGAHLDVVVTNPAGSITSTQAALAVSTSGPPPVAPTITQQPVNGTTTAPYPAMFSVVASGTPPLSYQWLLNGVAIPGANGASYGTNPTTIGQPPVTYSVVVWNAGGAVVSSGAILTVVAGAPLTVQSVTPAPGSAANSSLATRIGATFSDLLDCTSIDATSFQVAEGANPVAGAVDCTNATLTFTPSQPLPTRTALRAHLESSIRDRFGIALGAPYEWTFGMAPWTRQLGTAAHDEPLGLRADGAGNVLLTGYTAGGLEGNTLTGIVDAFAVKLAPSGARLWARQIGAASAFTYGYGVGADTAGNVFVAGHTNGTLPGNTSNGFYDLFLTKLDPTGNVLWTQQHGATLAVQVAGLAVDADGNSLVAGWTQGSLDGQTNVGAEDVFVVKVDTTGTRLWTRMFGSPATDYATSVALDPTGNILVAGYTRGSIDGNGNAGIDDLFVVKLAPDGSRLWARQLGSSAMDQAWSVTGDVAGNVYVAGWTRGSLDAQTSHGGQDIVVVKYDRDGVKQWTQQLGTAADDWATGITVDPSGEVYVVGGTHGPLDGGSNTSAAQLFIVKLDSAGAVRWVFQEGAQAFGYDLAETVTTDGSGNVFAAGITNGNLDGNTNAGDYDAFVVKVQQDGTPR